MTPSAFFAASDARFAFLATSPAFAPFLAALAAFPPGSNDPAAPWTKDEAASPAEKSSPDTSAIATSVATLMRPSKIAFSAIHKRELRGTGSPPASGAIPRG